MDTLTLLINARHRIAEGWTQKAFARDANQNEVTARSPDAVCWCTHGALFAAADSYYPNAISDAIDRLKASLPCYDADNTLAGWNDMPGHTQDEVLSIFDDAIARERTR